MVLIKPSRLGRPLEALEAFCKEVTVPGTFSAMRPYASLSHGSARCDVAG
jgi:hypothetical protein